MHAPGVPEKLSHASLSDECCETLFTGISLPASLRVLRPVKLFFFVYGRRVDDCSRLGGFLPKENFKVNTKSRRSRAPFEISISGLQSVDEELEDEMYGEDPMENMWYGWPRGVTGLRSPPDRKK